MGLAVRAGGPFHIASDAAADPTNPKAAAALSTSTASRTAFPASTHTTTVLSTHTPATTATLSSAILSPTALTTALTAAALAAAVSTVRFHHGKRCRVLQWVRAVTRERQPGVHVQRRHQGWEALLSRHDRA